MLKRIIPATAVVLLLIACAIVPALAVLPTGQTAPDFQLADLSNNVHKLSDYSGKVVVIDFFSPYCGYCQQDAKNNLIPLYNTYKNNEEVQFLSVETTGASVSTIQSVYLAATGPISWPILTNGANVATAYGIPVEPTVYIIDPAGKVALAMPYPIDEATLKSTIDQYAGSGQGWRAWEDLGGQLLPGTGPAVSSWASGRLDLFAIGANDHHLWHKSFQNGWSNWESLGGYLTSSPTAVSWGNGRIDVFARGNEGHTWHMWWQNGWGTWEDLGGQLLPGTGPAVSSWASGRLDLFAIGANDHQLWHRAWTGTSWANWEPLGGYLTSSPAAVSWGNGRIDIFARGGEGHTWHMWWQNGWGKWEDLGGQLLPGTGPAVSSWASGRLDLFVTGGGDRNLWHKAWTGTSWSNWESLGGILTSSPTAVSWGNGRIDIFARGNEGHTWHMWWQNG